MAERIPQSVAKLVVFRAFLASDGKTPATGKTIAITISKNGGAFGNLAAGATNATEISSGFYKFTIASGDSDTVGPLAWRGAEAAINDAADIYSVCTDLAGLTTLLEAIPTNAELATALGTADDAVLTAVGLVPAAVWAVVLESQGSYTAQQLLQIVLSITAGVTSSSGAVFKTPNGVSTRVSATINASNERTAMTLTP